MNLWPAADELAVATDHQREKYAMATKGRVGVLGGNPGAGKTWTAAQIIKAIVAQHGEASIAVAAPTGKAAVRITEAMLGHGLSVDATTIHRLLGVARNGHDGKGWGFMHNRGNPLQKRFIFADESSMIDIPTFASALDAFLPGTHLMLTGDFAQLPPVGHGAPLRDLIAAGVPYGELTEIHRNEGCIVRACRELKEGKPFRPSPYIDLAKGFNARHIEAARPAWAVGALGNLLRGLPAEYDRVWDVQILCAMNEKSEASREVLNKILQNILNPGDKVDGSRFRLGDKVICGTNCCLPMTHCPRCLEMKETPDTFWNGKLYECIACGKAWKPADCAKDFVANGEIGKAVLVEKGLLHVEFDSPQRTVRVSGEFLSEIDLAYAITCHKSQGSQWPIVITMVDDAADRVTSWEWHRTAWSRAEKLSMTIGKLSTIHRQCKKSALAGRKTFLKELLQAGFASHLVTAA
jgi:exodeoxyribonuclease V alpha subunit